MADPLRVSVIVPVYNTGAHIEQLIDSLAAQTLPQDEFEVIFADDGSTDETPARLDRLAQERDNVSVLHLPNSGWPGRPRNVATDAARGKYVFYVDHDDWLGAEALERMTAFASENRSDVVIGRYAGHRRGVAKALFHKTYPNATLDTAPIIDSLTPHKMFRRQFLIEHGLRFPEGRRRLEDHVFVVRAYFLAERISVMSDYHCYFHVGREDAGNAGYQRIDPAGYYGNVREVVEIMLAHTQPGRLRDKCLRRTLRTELLGRLGGNSFLKQDREYRRALFEEARQVAEESMPLSVDAGLPAPQRIRARFLRQDRLSDLEAYVAQDLEVKAVARLLDLRWNESSELIIEVEGALVDRTTGEPWAYARDDAGVFLRRPAGLRGAYPRDATDCSDRLPSSRLEIVLRRREDSEEWPVPTESSFDVHEGQGTTSLSYRARARVAPLSLGGGRPLTPGVWDVYVQISQTGWSGQVRLGSVRTDEATTGRRSALIAGNRIILYWTRPHDNLSLDMCAGADRLAGQLTPGPDGVELARGAEDGTSVRLTLPLFVTETTQTLARVQLTGPAGSVDVPAGTERSAGGDLTVTAELPRLEPGKWDVRLTLELPGWTEPKPIRTSLFVSADGMATVYVEPPPATRPGSRPAGPSLARRIGRRARRIVRRARR